MSEFDDFLSYKDPIADEINFYSLYIGDQLSVGGGWRFLT